METTTYKQNVDIKLARMTRFRNNFHQVLSILKPWKAKQFVYNCGSNKPKSLKISYGHSSPREENTIFEEEKKPHTAQMSVVLTTCFVIKVRRILLIHITIMHKYLKKPFKEIIPNAFHLKNGQQRQGIPVLQRPRVCSVCRNHNSLLSSFMTYYRVCSWSSRTGVISKIGYYLSFRSTTV